MVIPILLVMLLEFADVPVPRVLFVVVRQVTLQLAVSCLELTDLQGAGVCKRFARGIHPLHVTRSLHQPNPHVTSPHLGTADLPPIPHHTLTLASRW